MGEAKFAKEDLMIRWPRFWKLFVPRFSLRTLMLVVTLVAVGLWWGQRAVYFRQMAERHRNEAQVYRSLQEAHPTMADKCTAIVKYHMGLDAIYRNAVYTPWMIIYEHPYEASLVSEVNVRVEVAQTPSLDKPTAGLGLEGYCPVTLANEQKWVKGFPKFTAEFEGVTYHFAGADELQSFLHEPQRFAPAYGGIDVVRLVDEQKEIPGKRKFGISLERRIYLFDSEKSLVAFQSAPARYIAKAESAAIR